ISVPVWIKLPMQRDRSALHGLSRLIVAEVQINLGNRLPKICLGLGLIRETVANALGGLVQNFFQNRGVASLGDFGADSLKHLIGELSELLAFGGCDPG